MTATYFVATGSPAWVVVEEGEDGPYVDVFLDEEKARQAFDNTRAELLEHITESGENWFRNGSGNYLVELIKTTVQG